MTYYIVKYAGPFGFIKPWTAVRDSKTFSQQFLTPSIVEGIEKKLFPETLLLPGIHKIVRHKLIYSSVSIQQEVTQTRGWEYKKQQHLMVRNRSILDRGTLVAPVLQLAFPERVDAVAAAGQHICLCRNEDILFPEQEVVVMEEAEFDALDGFELRFGEMEGAFLVGFNRFDNAAPMYGQLAVSGNPVKNI
ncbi:hypothetical protein [Chitinophaga sp.]|uniref:hypothetical protein n=1 Tax=Chitinophaga sp. TaxID=1869181 RepID=UPI002F921C62